MRPAQRRAWEQHRDRSCSRCRGSTPRRRCTPTRSWTWTRCSAVGPADRRDRARRRRVPGADGPRPAGVQRAWPSRSTSRPSPGSWSAAWSPSEVEQRPAGRGRRGRRADPPAARARRSTSCGRSSPTLAQGPAPQAPADPARRSPTGGLPAEDRARWRLATDWADYAEVDPGRRWTTIPGLVAEHDLDWAQRWACRPLTRFEQRGVMAAGRLTDLSISDATARCAPTPSRPGEPGALAARPRLRRHRLLGLGDPGGPAYGPG